MNLPEVMSLFMGLENSHPNGRVQIKAPGAVYDINDIKPAPDEPVPTIFIDVK